jgi:hypothetical protein
VIELALARHDVRVDARSCHKVVVADEFADPCPRHHGKVQQRDAERCLRSCGENAPGRLISALASVKFWSPPVCAGHDCTPRIEAKAQEAVDAGCRVRDVRLRDVPNKRLPCVRA